MTREEKNTLECAACKVRMGIIEATHSACSGHPGGSLSAADLFTYLYMKELNVDPSDPAWQDRDPLSCPRDIQPRDCILLWQNAASSQRRN